MERVAKIFRIAREIVLDILPSFFIVRINGQTETRLLNTTGESNETRRLLGKLVSQHHNFINKVLSLVRLLAGYVGTVQGLMHPQLTTSLPDSTKNS